MMLVATLLALLQPGPAPEVLPVDERMAAYEAAFPGIAEVGAKDEVDLRRLGPAEAGWSTSGHSVASAIAARGGDPEQHVLGEWLVGGHGVSVPGDRPLSAPSGFR